MAQFASNSSHGAKFKSLLRGGRGGLERLYLVSPEFEPQC